MPDMLVADNLSMIQQGQSLLRTLPPDVFTARSPATLGASIGGHMRHIIDHYACFLRGVADGRIDYDEREREAAIENDAVAAIDALKAAAEGLAALPAGASATPISVHMGTGASTESLWSQSTVARELQFLISHTVHHFALIAMVCRMHGQEVGDDFGVAPSTLEHRRREAAACAR
jgi:uncharacterized damage-inducible protein DinB